jgi:hypothetical protein
MYTRGFIGSIADSEPQSCIFWALYFHDARQESCIGSIEQLSLNTGYDMKKAASF